METQETQKRLQRKAGLSLTVQAGGKIPVVLLAEKKQDLEGREQKMEKKGQEAVTEKGRQAGRREWEAELQRLGELAVPTAQGGG